MYVCVVCVCVCVCVCVRIAGPDNTELLRGGVLLAPDRLEMLGALRAHS